MFQIWEYFGKYLNKGNSNKIVIWATGSRNRGIFGPVPPPLDRDLESGISQLVDWYTARMSNPGVPRR